MAEDTLLQTLRLRGRLPAGELLRALGVSRATLMRAVRSAEGEVLSIGRTRRSSYAARRYLRGSGAPLSVFRVSPAGQAAEIGRLHLAHPHGCWLEGDAFSDWPLDADMRDGWFEGLPYPLQDMRPEGFLGRAFARRHAAVLQVAEDPTRWTEEDALHALSLMGSDTSGCDLIGEGAYRLWAEQRAAPVAALEEAELAPAYADLAERSLQQGVAGSSAGGEFPKFTALRQTEGNAPAHVLVKFSGSDDSSGTRRWADLLVCEHLALQAAAALPGLCAARTRILQAAGRTFLESERFDRHGAHGRSALCSWAAVNHAWFGLAGAPWTEGAARLCDTGLIDEDTRRAICRQWHFGQLIANTDMHDGNLSFVPGPEGRLQLAPMYDMLPMLYAPQRGVELPQREFRPRAPLPRERDDWRPAAAAAIGFWEAAAGHAAVSPAFRQLCRENADTVSRALETFGGD